MDLNITPPQLQMPQPATRMSPQVSTLLEEMHLRGILEEHQGPIFLSCPFTVPW